MKRAYFFGMMALALCLGSWANAQTLPATANRVFHVEATQANTASGQTTTSTLADGNSVGTWIDLSGNGKHVSQASGANQPAYMTNQVHARSAIVFNGSVAQYLVSASGANLTPTDIFAVVSMSSTAPQYATVVSEIASASRVPRIMRDSTNSSYRAYPFGTTSDDFPHSSPVSPTNFYINGQAGTNIIPAYGQFHLIHARKGNNGDKLFSQLSVGREGSDSSRFWKGGMAEIIMYGADQSANQNKIGIYLGWKYGIGTSYYDPDGPAVAITSDLGSVPLNVPQTLHATATSTNPISQVEFFVNGVSLGLGVWTGTDYTATWTAMAPGAYNVYAYAVDDAANIGQSPVITALATYYFVRPVATGSANGADWDNAMTFSAAIAAVQAQPMSGAYSVATIYMSSGTYALTANIPNFAKPTDLSIYGGFLGSETAPVDRSAAYWNDNPTTLSGESLYKMFNFGGLPHRFTLDGVNCANGSDSSSLDGTVYNFTGASGPTTSSVTFRRCSLYNNYAPKAGSDGAVVYYDGQNATVAGSEFIVHDCVFTSNTAEGRGGCITAWGIAINIDGSTFTQNTAINGNNGYGGGGAAIFLRGGSNGLPVSLTVSNSCFDSNLGKATDAHGAINMDRNGVVASAEFTSTVFVNNLATAGNGGAIRLNGAITATITNCDFVSNRALGGGSVGGAVFSDSTTLTVSQSVFDNNYCASRPGALRANGAMLTISDTTFTSNSSGAAAGGCVRLEGSSGNPIQATIVRSVFDGNRTYGASSAEGAAICTAGGTYGSLAISDSIFKNNMTNNATGSHGAAVSIGGDGRIGLSATNCLFFNNSAGGQAGAINAYGTNAAAAGVQLVNCTFNDNVARGGAVDGVYMDGGLTGGGLTKNIVLNCIFDGHRLAIDTDGTGAQVSVYNSGFGWNGANLALESQLADTFSAVPQFVNAPAGDFHLANNSPAIGAGAASADGLTAPASDIEGTILRGTPCDIGAYENALDAPTGGVPAQDVKYATPNGSGSGDGSSWANAATLPNAIANVADGGVVLASSGTYALAAPITLAKNMGLYGGCLGDETTPSARRADFMNLYPTTATALGPTRVFVVDSVANLTLDGVNVSDGYITPDMGGGMLVNAAYSLTVRNCAFARNVGVGGGGAIAVTTGVTYLTVDNCSFTTNSAWNSASGGGGGIYVANVTSLTATNLVFDGNWSNYAGGALRIVTSGEQYLKNCQFLNSFSAVTASGGAIWSELSLGQTFDSCVFYGNYTANANAGALSVSAGATTLIACAFTSNSALGPTTRYGGAIFNNGGALSADGCSFTSNTATSNGGAVYNSPASAVTMTNCSFTGNLSVGSAAALFNNNGALTMTDCAMVNNQSRGNGGAIFNNSNVAVTLTNCEFTENKANGTAGCGGLYINAGTVTISGGSFTGNTSNNNGGAVFLNSGGATITGCNFFNNVVLSNNAAGAVFVSAGVTTMTNCVMNFNRAGANGGAIGQSGGASVLINCQLTTNSCVGEGGAIRNSGGTLDMYSCSVLGNIANAQGGAISHAGTTMNVDNCVFDNNFEKSGSSGGGAIYFNKANTALTITRSTFTSNTATYCGGAIQVATGYASLTTCTFARNTGIASAGVFRIDAGRATFEACVFDQNVAKGASADGGVLQVRNSNIPTTWTRCLFAGNVASRYAGVFYTNSSTNSPLAAINCVFVNNTAGSGGGGVIYSAGNTGGVQMVNCTFANNRQTGNGFYDGLYLPSDGAAKNIVMNCIFSGHRIAIDSSGTGDFVSVVNCLTGLDSGNVILDAQPVNCIAANPGFVSASDFHLQDWSQAIGAGAPAFAEVIAPADDYEGLVRPQPDASVLDMGAFESALGVPSGADPTTRPSILFAAPAASGTGAGDKFSNAMALPQAVAAIGADGVILVKSGVIEINSELDVVRSMRIYGGFLGLDSETSVTQRPADFRASSPTTVTALGQCRVFNVDVVQTFEMDGVNVTDGWVVAGNGGGVQVYTPAGAQAILRNCVLTSNGATLMGGGLFFGGYGTVTVDRCWLSDNYAGTGGGGAQMSGDPICVFTNDVVVFNGASADGAAVRSAELTANGRLYMINCTLYGNARATAGTDGVRYGNLAAANTILLNCLLDNHNTALDNNGGTGPNATAQNCLIGYTGANNYYDLTMIGLLRAIPNFKNVAIRDFDLKNASLAISAGLNTVTIGGTVLNAPAVDYLGRPRIGGRPDIGAFENLLDVSEPEEADMYVKWDGTGLGTSWADATTLTTALSNVPQGGVIFMARGEHVMPAAGAITKQLRIYGGFVGDGGDGATNDRNLSLLWTDNATTISGNNANRCFDINLAGVVVLDGLCIEKGFYGSNNWGGGIYAHNGSLSLSLNRCIVANNRTQSGTTSLGGGIGCNGGNLAITRCLFDSNSANYSGGAIHFNGLDLIITSSTILNSLAEGTGGGGAIRIDGDSLTIEDSHFEGNRNTNTGGWNGGCVYVRNNNTPVVMRRSRFTGNSVAGNTNGGGSAILQLYTNITNSPVTAEDCVFDNNSAYGRGVIVNANGATAGLRFVHCTFASNIQTGGTPANLTGLYFTGVAGMEDKNLLVNCLFYGNPTETVVDASATGVFGRAYNCLFDGMAVNNCENNNPAPGTAVFVGTGADPYQLQVGSGGINAGMTPADLAANPILTAAGLRIPVRDKADNWRVCSGAGIPDTGAYELAQRNLILSPDPLHFGIVDAGSSVTTQIVVSNLGNVALTLDALKWATSGAPFSIVSPFAGTLNPDESAAMTLRFAPAAAGAFTGTLGYTDVAVPVTPAALIGSTPVSVISLVRLDATPSSAGVLNWEVTFTQPVALAGMDDFALITTGTFAPPPAIISVTPSGAASYIISVNAGLGDGQVQLILVEWADILDAVYSTGLTNKPFAGEVYDLDNVAPVIVSIVPREGVATPTSVSSVIYDVTFSEAVSGVTAANFFVVTVDGFATGSITGIVSAGGTASDTVWQVTVGNLASTNATGGYLRLDLSDVTGIGDKFFNPIALTAIGGSIWVDNVGPSINPLTSVEATSGATVGNVFATTVTFSEAVTGVTADKLTITTDGVTILAPTGMISLSATQYVFLLDDVYGSGPVTLNFTLSAATGDTIMDAAGIPFVTTQWSIIKDVSIVQVVIASAQVASGELTSRTQVTFHVNFSSPVTGFDPETQPGDLLLVNCAYVPGSFAVVSGTDYNFTVSPLGQGAASVRVPSNVCQTPAPPIRPNGDSNLYSVVFDTISPSFAGLTATPSRLQTDTTTTLNFTASEPLMADPIVTVNGNAAALVSQAGQNYTYEYFVPATDPESSATISMTGTDLAGATSTTLVLTALYVDKTAPVATIQSISPDSNALVTVDFSEGVTGVSAGDFTMTLNGAPFTGITNFTVVSPSQCTFNVPNAATGIYVLTLTAAGSGIQDLAGIPMTANATATWAVAPGAAVVKHWTRY